MTWAAISKHGSGGKWFGRFQGVCHERCFCLMTELTVVLMHLEYDSWSLRGGWRFHGWIHRINLATAACAQPSWPAKLSSFQPPGFLQRHMHKAGIKISIGFFVLQMAAKHCKMDSMQFKGCATWQVGSRFYIPLLLSLFLGVRWRVLTLVFLFLTSPLHFARLRLVSYLPIHFNFISDDKIQLSLSGLVL